MLCKQPVKLNVRNGTLYNMRCGQCVECRQHLQACWIARLLLERQSNEYASLVTLTYDSTKILPVLLKPHIQDFLKRLRERYPGRIRYYFVGEYGKQKNRAHWHGILYGVDRSWKDLLQQCWGLGFIDTGYTDLNYASCRYFCKYLMNKDKFRNRGTDNVPVLMSKRPAIGSETIWKYGKRAAEMRIKLPEIPINYLVGGKTMPLDRTMRAWFVKGLEAGGLEAPMPPSAVNLDSMTRLCVKANVPATWANMEVIRKFFVSPPQKSRKEEKRVWFDNHSKARKAAASRNAEGETPCLPEPPF